ncbi:MAG: PQQ-binding-like beta-propeller repeat protein [Planctomycetaceae bacterium]
MKRLPIPALLILLAASMTPATAQIADSEPALAPEQTVVSIPSLTPHWSAQAILNQSVDKVAHLTGDEDVIVIQSVSGMVTVLSAQNGREHWSSQVGPAGDASLPAASDPELLAIITGPTVHIYQKFTGDRICSYRLPLQPAASPTLVRREPETAIGKTARWIFIPLIDGSITAYDIDILERLGTLGQLPEDIDVFAGRYDGVDRAEGWRYRIGEEIPYQLIASKNRLALATTAGNVFTAAMFGSDAGSTRFQFLMRSSVSSPAALSVRRAGTPDQAADERLVSTTRDGRIFCVDVNSSGHMYWSRSLGLPVERRMMTLDDELYVINSENNMMRLNVEDGETFPLSQGTGTVASQSESRRGQLRAYGASLEVAVEGLTAFSPFRIANRSTKQQIRVITLDISETEYSFEPLADNPSAANVRALQNSSEQTGLSTIEMSPDQKQITLSFTSFDPDEYLYLGIGLTHPEMKSWEISDDAFVGSEIRALVAPKRTAASVASGATEAFPPSRIIGRLEKITTPWKVQGISKLLAVSSSAVYVEDLFERIIGFHRDTAEPAFLLNGGEFTHKLFNDRTDRVIACTSRGRVVSFAERRMQFGLIPVPCLVGNVWAVGPTAELAIDFARFHRNPGGRPLMPDVPAQDPAAAQQQP